MRYSVSLSIVLLAVLGILFAGCGQQTQQVAQDEVVSVKATIEADCIVHYYKTNTSAYITRQRHGYDPESGFFAASSMEPTGNVRCSLIRDIFDSSGQRQPALSDLPGSFWSKNLATALFYSFCAGGNLLETESLAAGENIRIEGQWYKPLRPAWPDDVNLTLLQSLDSARIEMVQLEDSQNGLIWLARNSNYRYSKDLGERVPRSIDVFDIRDGIASKVLMIRFDYKDIQNVAIPSAMN